MWMVDRTLVGGSGRGCRASTLFPIDWRITFNNPPLNVMGPQFVQEFRDVVTAIEDDEQVKVVVFDSAVDGYFLNHSDFLANFDDLVRPRLESRGPCRYPLTVRWWARPVAHFEFTA